MELAFTKMHGLGNDFIMIEDLEAGLEKKNPKFLQGEIAVMPVGEKVPPFVQHRFGVEVMFAVIPRDVFPSQDPAPVPPADRIRDIHLQDAALAKNPPHFPNGRQMGKGEMFEGLGADHGIEETVRVRDRVHFHVAQGKLDDLRGKYHPVGIPYVLDIDGETFMAQVVKQR